MEASDSYIDVTDAYVDKSDEIKIPLFFAKGTRVSSKFFFTFYGIILLITLLCSSILLVLSFSGKSGNKFVSNTKK